MTAGPRSNALAEEGQPHALSVCAYQMVAHGLKHAAGGCVLSNDVELRATIVMHMCQVVEGSSR